MPTPKEIKKITNEIARFFVHPDDHTPYGEQTYRQVEAVITQLSKDYCIVEKGVLKSAYNEAQRGFDNASDPLYPTSDYYMGRMSVLKDIFNSLFEEDKK